MNLFQLQKAISIVLHDAPFGADRHHKNNQQQCDVAGCKNLMIFHCPLDGQQFIWPPVFVFCVSAGEFRISGVLSVCGRIYPDDLLEAGTEIILVGIPNHGADLLQGTGGGLQQHAGLLYPDVRDIGADVLLLVFFKERA